MFDTWGPYTCRTNDDAGIDALWEEFRADATTKVEDGVGIYVVGVKGPDGGQSGMQEKLDRKFIDWLEVDLIDKCRVLYRELLNRQFVKFLERIWVGGYRGREALDPDALENYPAYRALATMLQIDREGQVNVSSR